MSFLKQPKFLCDLVGGLLRPSCRHSQLTLSRHMIYKSTQKSEQHAAKKPIQNLEDVLFSALSDSNSDTINVLKFKEMLFSACCDGNTNTINAKKFKALEASGLRSSDPRLVNAMRKIAAVQKAASQPERQRELEIDKDTFVECVSENIVLIARAFRNQFVIPDWHTFTRHIEDMYDHAKDNNAGQIATYIPQLARANPDHWSVSVCTIDGQRFSIGDTDVPFCIQSMGKPFIYAQALDALGAEKVHKYVGHEPSGKRFNYISLNEDNKPHNALVNSGAIIICSLIKPDWTSADRFDYLESSFKELAGNEYVGFNNATFLSEKATADRNFALSYYMQENKCFPQGTNMMDILDLYFQICSVEVTTDSGAVMAATLANGGICPTTGQRIYSPATVRDTLSVMYSCGMYDYSGRFAFSTGIPSKSGVSGGIVMSIPNVMGICMYSPLLDLYGNSVRGVQFSEDITNHQMSVLRDGDVVMENFSIIVGYYEEVKTRPKIHIDQESIYQGSIDVMHCHFWSRGARLDLVNKFNFHNFDNLMYTATKLDPRRLRYSSQAREVVNLMYGAYNGDVSALRRLLIAGVDMSQQDYDSRSALHIGAAEGYYEVTKFFLEKCNVSPYIRDRWGNLPIHDAQRFGHTEVEALLKKHMPEGVPVEESCDTIATWGNLPIHDAQRFGHTEVVALLKKHMHLNWLSRWGNLPIHDAQRFGHTEVEALLKKHMPEGVPVEESCDTIAT